MTLPPKFAGHRLTLVDVLPLAPHTIEVYLDYTCPYAARTFATLIAEVLPVVRADPALAGAIQVIFRQQVQPWHPASTLTHEAALAVLRTAPDLFWSFSAALFAAQREFFDASAAVETRNQTYARLARIADGVGANGDALLDLLRVPEVPSVDAGYNAGNAVTGDLKEVIKMARLVGVHVTPTVVFDGVVQDQISSTWTGEQWIQWLKATIEVTDRSS